MNALRLVRGGRDELDELNDKIDRERAVRDESRRLQLGRASDELLSLHDRVSAAVIGLGLQAVVGVYPTERGYVRVTCPAALYGQAFEALTRVVAALVAAGLSPREDGASYIVELPAQPVS